MSHLPSLTLAAHAKINWTLEVLQRRADGYHDLLSIMQTIALHDSVRLTLHDALEITGWCNWPLLQNADNLAIRAAHLLRNSTSQALPGVHIDLYKRVPLQAGLGGGSSDAAAVLTGLNRLWNLRLSLSELEGLGAQLGSDIPFFIRGGTALVQGRGELVHPLPTAGMHWLVLLKPAIGLSTARIFASLTVDDMSNGQSTHRLVRALEQEHPLHLRPGTNSMTHAVWRQYPVVAAAAARMQAAGAGNVCMSGSGSTLFTPFDTLEEALPLYHALQCMGDEVWLTHTLI